MSRQEITLNIGGKLETGDVVCVAFKNRNVFGWFIEGGQNGSLKFITTTRASYTFSDYNNYLVDTDPPGWKVRRYSKGLVFKNFTKEYILKYSKVDNRAFKIVNPEEFFKNSEEEFHYLNGKKGLNSIKFPAK